MSENDVTRSAKRTRAGRGSSWLTYAAAFTCAVAISSCSSKLTLKVTSTADSGAGSLRAAIAAANAANDYLAVTVEIPPGTYSLDSCASDDDNNAGDLDIVTNLPVTLLATGTSVVITQTCAGERVLDAHGSGLLTLTGVTLTGGSLTNTDPTQIAEGGGLRVVGDAELKSATLTGNSATGATGSLQYGGGARGGGLFVGGSLVATDSTISSNVATGGAGTGEYVGVATAGGPAEGGGACVVGSFSMVGGAIAGNRALGGTGASGARSGSGGTARGGGVAQETSSTGTFSLANVTLSNNVAQGGTSGTGGSVSSLTETTGHFSDGKGDATGGAVAAAGALRARSITVTQNKALGGDSSTCAGCSASMARGGALAASATATITDGSFTLNEAISGARQYCTVFGPSPGSCPFGFCYIPGFGCLSGSNCPTNPPPLCTVQTGLAAEGGAIFASANLELSGGSCSRNTTVLGTAIRARGDISIDRSEYLDNAGGAIRGESSATIRAARFERNGLLGENTIDVGGRLALSDTLIANSGSTVIAGEMDVVNVTVNSSTFPGIAAFHLMNSNLSRFVNTTIVGLERAIVGENVALDHVTVVSSGASVPDVLGVTSLTSHRSIIVAAAGQTVCPSGVSVQASSYNSFSDASCALNGTADQQTPANFALGALADNGGAVPTVLPGRKSVLINRIPTSACPVAADARGIPRPQGRGCDIGAVEVQN
jgi:hypothetical protein